MAESSDDGRRLSRRRFFRLGIAGSIVLGAGGVLAWQTSGYEVPASVARRLRHLSAKELRIVEAVAERIVRSDDDAFPSAAEVEVALQVDAILDSLHPADRRELLGLLHLLEHALPPWSGTFGRFTRLDGSARDAVLESMRSGSSQLMRGAFEGLKSLVVLAYFRDERTWGPIGYDGPLVGRPRGGFR
jgi:hypothetical protein